jgi:hypothetical protein
MTRQVTGSSPADSPPTRTLIRGRPSSELQRGGSLGGRHVERHLAQRITLEALAHCSANEPPPEVMLTTVAGRPSIAARSAAAAATRGRKRGDEDQAERIDPKQPDQRVGVQGLQRRRGGSRPPGTSRTPTLLTSSSTVGGRAAMRRRRAGSRPAR